MKLGARGIYLYEYEVFVIKRALETYLEKLTDETYRKECTRILEKIKKLEKRFGGES